MNTSHLPSEYGFWIEKHKLKAVMIMLSLIVKHNFLAKDEEAILFGLIGTNDEENHWFDYVFTGEINMRCSLAFDSENSDIIHIYIKSGKDLIEKIQLINAIQAAFNNIAYVKVKVNSVCFTSKEARRIAWLLTIIFIDF